MSPPCWPAWSSTTTRSAPGAGRCAGGRQARTRDERSQVQPEEDSHCQVVIILISLSYCCYHDHLFIAIIFIIVIVVIKTNSTLTRFLGEMYNYRLADSSLIFKVLYSLITFGVSLDPDLPSPLDPPNHMIRLRLVSITALSKSLSSL